VFGKFASFGPFCFRRVDILVSFDVQLIAGFVEQSYFKPDGWIRSWVDSDCCMHEAVGIANEFV
jgi:hypothetical protein